jgi:hypothetical protein
MSQCPSRRGPKTGGIARRPAARPRSTDDVKSIALRVSIALDDRLDRTLRHAISIAQFAHPRVAVRRWNWQATPGSRHAGCVHTERRTGCLDEHSSCTHAAARAGSLASQCPK